MMKILNKLGIKGNFLSLIKNIYKNPTANIKLNGKILNGLLLRSGRGEGCSGNAQENRIDKTIVFHARYTLHNVWPQKGKGSCSLVSDS